MAAIQRDESTINPAKAKEAFMALLRGASRVATVGSRPVPARRSVGFLKTVKNMSKVKALAIGGLCWFVISQAGGVMVQQVDADLAERSRQMHEAGVYDGRGTSAAAWAPTLDGVPLVDTAGYKAWQAGRAANPDEVRAETAQAEAVSARGGLAGMVDNARALLPGMDRDLPTAAETTQAANQVMGDLEAELGSYDVEAPAPAAREKRRAPEGEPLPTAPKLR